MSHYTEDVSEALRGVGHGPRALLNHTGVYEAAILATI
jgi:hypothetical protein